MMWIGVIVIYYGDVVFYKVFVNGGGIIFGIFKVDNVMGFLVVYVNLFIVGVYCYIE